MTNKEYKPILVFYLEEAGDKDMASIKEFIEENNKFGYENVVVICGVNIESRVEIISVDKATIVEDIQKYINSKFE